MPFALQAGGTLRVLDLFAERAKRSGPLRPSFIEQYDCVIISYDHLGKELYHRRQVLATTTTDSAYGNQDQSRDAGMVALMRRARTSRRPSS